MCKIPIILWIANAAAPARSAAVKVARSMDRSCRPLIVHVTSFFLNLNDLARDVALRSRELSLGIANGQTNARW